MRFVTSTTVIVLSFLFISLAGCGQKHTPKLTIALGGTSVELDVWEKIIAGFTQKTGIEVDFLRQPSDTDQRRQQLIVSLNASQPLPDVFLMDVTWTPLFSASHWLEPLDSYINEDKINVDVFFQPAIKNVDTYNNKIIALPVYIDGGLLYYRKDLLEKYGYSTPPQTWEQLVIYATAISKDIQHTNPNVYGFVWQGAQYEGLVCNFLEFASSGNGGILFDGNKININSAENQAALQFMCDLINKYHVSPHNTFTEMKEDETRIIFQQGNALFERNWPYAFALHQSPDSAVRNKFGISVLPHFENGISSSTLGGWHIGISRFSRLKKESWQLVKFIESYDVQKQLVLDLGWNPSRKDLYADKEILQKMPHFSELKSIFEHTVARPICPYYSQISKTIQKFLNAALAGRMTPKSALDSAQLQLERIVEYYEQ